MSEHEIKTIAPGDPCPYCGDANVVASVEVTYVGVPVTNDGYDVTEGTIETIEETDYYCNACAKSVDVDWGKQSTMWGRYKQASEESEC